MNKVQNKPTDEPQRVVRTKEQTKKVYDKMSPFYDFFASVFERKHTYKALASLQIQKGENVLEIGFGTGQALKKIAYQVGLNGRVSGTDISSGMLEITKKRLEKAGVLDRVSLYCGDALEMSYPNQSFDAVFMSFTLELFDPRMIPIVLQEIRRVLKVGGRLGVTGISQASKPTLILKIYTWAHRQFPNYIDCEPILIEQSVKKAGFQISHRESRTMFGIPIEIVVGFSPG